METTYALNENETLQEIKRPPRIGFIKTFAGTTPPEGTLLCDGSAVSRDTYSELFDVIGTTWGEGDGSTTFNLPDLRDVWILCAGTEHEAGDSVAEGLPNINASFTTVSNANQWLIRAATGAFYKVDTPNGSGEPQSNYAPATGKDVNSVFLDASRSSAIYGASQHVTPASVAVLPCIVFE